MKWARAILTSAFWSELRLIGVRAEQVWRMVPEAHKWAFAGASLMMALTSLSAVAVPVVLGRLVDEMAAGVNRQAGAQELLNIAASLLGIIAALVILRELFNVVRRFLVENTCTRIDKHLSMKVIARLLKVE